MPSGFFGLRRGNCLRAAVGCAQCGVWGGLKIPLEQAHGPRNPVSDEALRAIHRQRRRWIGFDAQGFSEVFPGVIQCGGLSSIESVIELPKHRAIMDSDKGQLEADAQRWIRLVGRKTRKENRLCGGLTLDILEQLAR